RRSLGPRLRLRSNPHGLGRLDWRRRLAGSVQPHPPLIDAGVLPQLTGDPNWIDAGRLPPSSLVAGAMHRAMMDTAERYGEFIASLAAERARLQVEKVMRIRWLAAADEAWLLGDRAKVLPVAITPWCGNGEHAFVDAFGSRDSACGRGRLLRICIGDCRSI